MADYKESKTTEKQRQEMTSAAFEKPKPSVEPPKRSALDVPGPLQGESSMTIHTREAQRLILGRQRSNDKNEIIGLRVFATLIAQLYFSARCDDPFVDSWLIEIEDVLQQCQEAIDALRETVTQRIASLNGLTVETAVSAQPVKVPLRFNNPYAFQGVQLILAFDQLMCLLLTARHIGLLDREQTDHIRKKGGQAVRRYLGIPSRYPRGVIASREDLRQGTARAQAAIERYGKPPADVLAGTRRAAFAPEIFSSGPATAKSTFFNFE